MKTKRLLKQICAFILMLSMLFSPALPVSADLAPDDVIPGTTNTGTSVENPGYLNTEEGLTTKPLRARDNIFTVDVYSAKAGGKLNGLFFKRDNTLYVEKDTLFEMAEIWEVTLISSGKRGLTRDSEAKIAYFPEEESIYTFDGQTFYPFVDAITDLCLTAVYDYDLRALRIIPAKNAFDIPATTEKLGQNWDYQMYSWRNTEDAEWYQKLSNVDNSRAVAKATDIGRSLFSLPQAVYKYASGDADYELYRTALWEITLPEVSTQITSIDTFKEEKAFLDILEVNGEINKLFPVKSEFWGLASEDSVLAGTAAGFINDAGTIMQYEDCSKVMTYYYNMDNVNVSVANGLELISKTGLGEYKLLNSAIEDMVALNRGDEALSLMFLEEMGDGLVEFAFGQVDTIGNDTLGEFAVGALDYLGKNYFPDKYNAKEQIEATLKASSHLRIQDAAKRSYNYYTSVYESAKSYEKQYAALQNMRDTMLVYMLAGHGAWKALEADPGTKSVATNMTFKMAKEINKLLAYGEEDFRVYQNALNAKHAILANYEGREQTYYFFQWDKNKEAELGGIQFYMEGLAPDGMSLLHQYSFADIYYLRNGLFIGRVTKPEGTSGRRILEYYNTNSFSEIVIKGKFAGSSVAGINLKIATGLSGNNWTGDLDRYLVTDDNGNVIYRIPLPLGSGISEGKALPTTSITGSPDSPSDTVDGVTANLPEAEVKYPSDFNYVPAGPFDGEYSVDYRNNYQKYRISIPYNSDLLYVMGEPDFYYARVAFKDDKEDIEEKYFADINYFYKDFEYIKATFLEDEDIVVTEFKEIIFPNSTVKMYVFYNKNWPNNVRYEFFGDLGIGINLNGNYYPEKVMDKDALTFEQFILELFSNITVETLTWP